MPTDLETASFAQLIAEFRALVAEQDATTTAALAFRVLDVTTTPRTLTTDDTGAMLLMNSSANMVLRLPNNLPRGHRIGVTQEGTGKVTFTALAGAAVTHRQGYTKTAGPAAVAGLYVKRNTTGTAAEYVLSGDVIA
jgi:hypothetical protein